MNKYGCQIWGRVWLCNVVDENVVFDNCHYNCTKVILSRGSHLYCHLLKHLWPRSRFLISKKCDWSSFLNYLICYASKVRLQPCILDLLISQFGGDLDRLSKRALIAWLNFDPGRKCFHTGHISDYLMTMLADQHVLIVVARLSKRGFELPSLRPRLGSGYIVAKYYGAIPTLFVGIYL